MKIKNTQAGIRGVNTPDGRVMIQPGETVDVDLSPVEFESAKNTGWFEIDGRPSVEELGDE